MGQMMGTLSGSGRVIGGGDRTDDGKLSRSGLVIRGGTGVCGGSTF